MSLLLRECSNSCVDGVKFVACCQFHAGNRQVKSSLGYSVGSLIVLSN